MVAGDLESEIALWKAGSCQICQKGECRDVSPNVSGRCMRTSPC